MNLLALETSTRMGSIALLSDGSLIAEYQMAINTAATSELLLPAIEQVLHASGFAVAAIDMFAVAQGPGSFTALRIGMSVVTGMAIAAGKKIVAVPSLDGLAYNAGCGSHLICPMIDARRGEVYCAFYRYDHGARLQRTSPYLAALPEQALSGIDETVILLGDGVNIFRDRIVGLLGKRAWIAPRHLHYPRASALGMLALQRLNDSPDAAQDAIAPIYVRQPDADAK